MVRPPLDNSDDDEARAESYALMEWLLVAARCQPELALHEVECRVKGTLAKRITNAITISMQHDYPDNVEHWQRVRYLCGKMTSAQAYNLLQALLPIVERRKAHLEAVRHRNKQRDKHMARRHNPNRRRQPKPTRPVKKRRVPVVDENPLTSDEEAPSLEEAPEEYLGWGYSDADAVPETNPEVMSSAERKALEPHWLLQEEHTTGWPTLPTGPMTLKEAERQVDIDWSTKAMREAVEAKRHRQRMAQPGAVDEVDLDVAANPDPAPLRTPARVRPPAPWCPIQHCGRRCRYRGNNMYWPTCSKAHYHVFQQQKLVSKHEVRSKRVERPAPVVHSVSAGAMYAEAAIPLLANTATQQPRRPQALHY